VTAVPWRAITVDDEPPALKRMRAMLGGVTGLQLVGEYDDPRVALDAIRRDRPDVVFLDIQMPEMTGFDLVAALDDPLPLIVFVTAYDEHAIRAFEVNAADYLLKPVSRERLAATIARVTARLGGGETGGTKAQLDAIVQHASAGALPPRVAIRVDGRVVLLAAHTIDRVEADGNTLRAHVGRETFDFRETLTAFEARLPAGRFLRVSRSALVNVERVRHAEPWFHGDYVLVLTDGAKVVTGRTYRDRVRAALGLP
jgi:two-component system LytT family response regulator